ncbi:sugar-binding transcriptional regulator [Aestuariimicrobium soli]|uniref:sugar-binding transcriptional regulator n=1 Tax=Aestuariimicrobium soli TaxID=2035834 RepID=UPI003EBB6D7A
MPDDLYAVAQLYYVQGETMDAIARQFNTSRSTISRLLSQARESGVVEIHVRQREESTSTLASTLRSLFGVNVTVVPVKGQATEVVRLDKVARVAARELTEIVREGDTIGVAWGTTLNAIVSHLHPREHSGTTLVQLNGGANGLTTGIPYVGSIMSTMAQLWDSQMVLFPVPAFFDYAETREAMWRERSVQHVRSAQRAADVAVFGVGSMSAGVPSHVYSAGYLSEDDLHSLRSDRVVGDVCTVLLREDGSWRDVELNRRASGLTPAELQFIPRRLCVASGVAKAVPLLAALRAHAVTDVVLDDGAARALLERL